MTYILVKNFAWLDLHIKHIPGLDQFTTKYNKFEGLIPPSPSPSPQFSEIMDLEFHSRSKNGFTKIHVVLEKERKYK